MKIKKKLWELKQLAGQPDILEMYLYGNVESDGYDYWSDEKVSSETSANHFRDELAKYPDIKQIKVFINSYGGDVFEGTAIYSQLKRHAAEVIVQIDGFACSIASLIAMAGDQVIMPANTMMMIHNAWMGIFGNAKELRKAADDLDAIMEGNMEAYLLKADGKITKDKLMELLDGETWLTAKQCLEYGFADQVLTKETDMTEAQALLQKVNLSLEAKVSYNKAIAAQLRDMTETKEAIDDPKVIEAIEDIEAIKEDPKENNLKKLFLSLSKIK